MGYDFYLLVCNYFPGPPSDFINRRPYRQGFPCTGCGAYYPECRMDLNPTFEDDTSNLCCKAPLSVFLSFSISLTLSVFNSRTHFNTHRLLLIQTTLRMFVLVPTHTLPFAYMKEVFSATLSRASITPPSTSSATTNYK